MNFKKGDRFSSCKLILVVVLLADKDHRIIVAELHHFCRKPAPVLAPVQYWGSSVANSSLACY
jgi:hypothetical protein